MRAGRSESEQPVIYADSGAVDQRVTLDDADTESREVKVVARIHARHFGGLSAEQCGAGLPAPLSNATDHRLTDTDIQFSDRVIIEKEEWFRALHDDIIDAHRDKVDADRIEAAEFDCEFEFSADTIRAGNENGSPVFFKVQFEQSAEPADVAQNALPLGSFYQRFNAFDQRIAGVDVHTGILIGQRFIRTHVKMPVRYTGAIIIHMRTLQTLKPFLNHLILMCLVLTVLSSGAEGARVGGLYTAEVELPGGSSSALPQAFDAALGQVLVKVTGQGGAAADSVVMESFGDSSVLVQQYRINPDDTVWVMFDPVGIKRILDQLEQPIWGEERPTTLVWLIMDAGEGERTILASDSDVRNRTDFEERTKDSQIALLEESIREELQNTADQRGVPIFLPLVDTEELATISVSEVWGGFSESLVDASIRYGADAVLVGRARLSSRDPAEVRWTLLLEQERFDWAADIASGPNELANLFAARLATSGGSSRRVLLEVVGIETLNDYGRISKYLSALDVIEDYSVNRVSDSDVIFSLSVRGDVEHLTRTIALRGVLEIVNERTQVNVHDASIPDIAAKRLRYRLVPEL